MNQFFDDMNSTKEQMSPLVTEWAQRLTSNWEISSEWHFNREEDTFKCAAWVDCDWRYLHATIHFSLPVLCIATEDVREGVIVHELTHLLVNQMRGTMNWDKNDMANEERVVTILDRLLIRLKYPD